MKVLIADKIEEECIRRLTAFPGIEVEIKTGLSEEDLVRVLPGYEALIVRSATKVTAAAIEAGGSLKVIGRAGAGVDTIDVEAATAKGIVVMNTPGGNAAAVAELVIGLMFCLARRIPWADAAMKAGRWEKKSLSGSELAGKTLGLLGIGNVGGRVARKAAALAMRVLAHDPYAPAGKAGEPAVQRVDLEQLYRESDFVSLHVPKTKETAGMIDARAFGRMKRGVFLVNCARGGIVKEADLLQALEQGTVAGAAMDVYQEEPPTALELVRHPRVIATPHIGASTGEAQVVVAEMIAEQVGRFLTEGIVRNAVNR